MFTTYIALVVLGSVGIVLLPDTAKARRIKYAIYAVILAVLLFFLTLIYGQYVAHASL
jgi:Ca2+/Na+ antiporter